MQRRLAVTVLCALAAATASPVLAQRGGPFPYNDADLNPDMRARDLLARMRPEEKFWQLYMTPGDLSDSTHDWSHGVFGLQVPAQGLDARAQAARINAIQRWFVERTRLGIPIIPFEEALHGLVREGATVFPQAIALAATFDTALVGRVAGAVARETRSRGVRDVLSPVVNLATDVRWGRTEETYGEDPFLGARMAAAFVAPFEAAGVVTTPKHFVANVGEGGRDSYPIEWSERRLQEREFAPFEAALRAGARSVMTAYNSIDGAPATQNRRLLTDWLRGAWGFTGVVVSDAAATGGATVLHMTEPSTPVAAQHAWNAGLDVVFQSSWPQHRPYLAAVQSGLVAPAVVDSAVARVLRLKFALGLFERPYVDPDSAAAASGSRAHIALAREVAAASMVLLRNARGRLPLARSLRRVAVIGVDASEGRLGGYSGPGERRVNMVDGIRAALPPGATVRYEPGPGRTVRTVAAVPAAVLSSPDAGGVLRPGLIGEYFGAITLEGAPLVTRRDPAVDFGWTLNAPAPGLPTDWYAVRWTGRLAVPPGGARRLGVEGSDGWRLWLDDRLVLDNWRKVGAGMRLADVALRGGSTHALRLEYHETTGNAHVRLVWDAGVRDSTRERIAAAVAAARASEVAIVVAGLEEGEFRDRSRLGLPGAQEDLIAAVAATGVPTVVVLVGGSAVTMPWLERVDAVLDAWYPGEQGGHAVADVLFGAANPAGRLPVSFPMREGQLPLVYNHHPTGRGDDYMDGSGEPLFPFGYGLSYTTFAYTNLRIEPAVIEAGGQTTIRCTVRNAGARPGDEVVQLYLHDDLASRARPVRSLRGFRRIALAPGDSTDIEFTVGAEDLRMLDADRHWVVEPGAFRVTVGASSRDLRLRGILTVR